MTTAFEWLSHRTVLFLAKFAPTDDPLEYDDVPYSSAYHCEIAELLGQCSGHLINSRRPGDLLKQELAPDLVFSLFNRIPCPDGEVFPSAVCAYRDIPIVGASPHMRATAEDKHLAKLAAKRAGLETPDWVIHRHAPRQAPFPGPYFIKPRFGAASDGISGKSLQQTWDGAVRYAKEQSQAFGDQLIEAFVDGQNVTLPILGGCEPEPLDPVAVHGDRVNNIISKTEKFAPNQTRDYALVHRDSNHLVVKLGRQLTANLDPFDYARIDFRICSRTHVPYFLEFNLCCDISSQGSFMFSAASRKLTHKAVLSTVLEACLWRHQVLG